MTTTDRIEGQKIVRVLGLVRGNSIRTPHLGKDIMAVLRGIVGGEVAEYTKLFGESREQSLDRMTAEAEELGANAVLCMRFSTSMVIKCAGSRARRELGSLRSATSPAG